MCQGFSSVSTIADEEPECDISSLLEMLGKVPDPRSARGRMYRLSFILAVSLVTVLAGASNFRQIRDQVADMPQSLLRKLGGTWCYFRRLFGWPSERTIRRVLEAIDAATLDRIAGAWLQANARRGAEGALELAIDGKVMRGSWTDANEQFTLFSAMIHRAGVTIGQLQVPADTNEITQVKTLLDTVSVPDGTRVVVTADAAHTQRETAEYLKGERGFDYVLTVKANQPQLLESVFQRCLPRLRDAPDHIVEERGHGRVSQWQTWVTDAADIDFPRLNQVACIRRNIFTTGGSWISKEHAWIVTSGDADTTTAADVHTHIRQHWGIENKSHYTRDTTWREDAQQVYTGSGPQVMATLRNIALGLIRLKGIDKIKETTEWVARDRNRALTFLVT